MIVLYWIESGQNCMVLYKKDSDIQILTTYNITKLTEWIIIKLTEILFSWGLRLEINNTNEYLKS